VQILASNLKNELWRERIKNLNIRLQAPTEDKNINLEVRPTHCRQAWPSPARRAGKAPIEYACPERSRGSGNVRFGLIVNVDINNLQIKDDLTSAEINDILAFAEDYVSDELIKFLNNEY